MIILVRDPYSREVRQYFVRPVHAGRLRKPYSPELAAEVMDGSAAAVRLAAGIEADLIEELRFEVLGCPHLIAAAEHFCRTFEGRATADLESFRPEETMRDLQIPLAKTGRILLLEDAIQLLRQKIGKATKS